MSSLPFKVCLWKHPNSQDPCGILSDDLGGKSCNAAWNGAEGGEGWVAKLGSDRECTLTGTIGVRIYFYMHKWKDK